MVVTIKKGTVRTTVDEELFNEKYKPKGWEIEHYDLGGTEEVECNDFEVKTEVKTQADITQILNTESAKKKRVVKKFDDKLVKEKVDV